MRCRIIILLCSFCIKLSISVEPLSINDKLSTILDNRPKDLADMDIKELLNVVERNKFEYQKSLSVYEQKYGAFQIEISNKFEILNDIVSVDYTKAESFLKTFGHTVTRLSVAHSKIPAHELNEIGRLVNLYCSDTLIKFNGKAVFDGMQKTFRNVKSVSISGELNQLAKDLNELFPRMQILNLAHTGNYSFNHHYPNLDELNYFTSNGIEEVIAKNPQIRKLKLQGTTMETLQTVNQFLPKLRTFTFNMPSNLVSYQGSPIQFVKVKEVAINDLGAKKRSGKIAFKQLKSLELNLQSAHIVWFAVDDWMGFIGENSGLKKLKITGDKFRDLTFSKLNEKLSTLTEANFQCYSDVKSQSITQFTEHNPRMRKLTLNLPHGSEKLLKNLTQELNEDWKITPENDRFTTLSLVKLSPDTDESDKESIEEFVTENESNTDNDADTDATVTQIDDKSNANTNTDSGIHFTNENAVSNASDTTNNDNIDTNIDTRLVTDLNEDSNTHANEKPIADSSQDLTQNLNTDAHEDSNAIANNDNSNADSTHASKQELIADADTSNDQHAKPNIQSHLPNSNIDSNEIITNPKIDENADSIDKNSQEITESAEESNVGINQAEGDSDNNANTSIEANTSAAENVSQNATAPVNVGENGASYIHSRTILSITFLFAIVSMVI